MPTDSAPSDTPQHALLKTAAKGPWGGPIYSYRGAEIRCPPGGNVCGLFMDEHPLHSASFRVAGAITKLVDVWLDEDRLPDHMHAAPKG